MPPKKNLHTIGFYANIATISGNSESRCLDIAKAYSENTRNPGIDALVASDFEDAGISPGSIAYHPVFGNIYYRSRRAFSMAGFMDDLKKAEENPSIAAHLVHVASLGGEAFGCHEAFEIIRGLKKPCYGLIDTVAASAGYYLLAGCKKIYASSMFSQVGCIGTMAVLYDDAELWKMCGYERHEYNSNYSPFKNKVFDDAAKGDGDEFVKRFLDPLALQFVDDVRSARPGISEAALQGETYYAADALSEGLIDGEDTLEGLVDSIKEEIRLACCSAPAIDINKINF